MKKLTTKSFEEIRTWIYRNARQLELTIWQHEFENGSADAVLSALLFYQNPDGGFGNALEPDCWNPDSSPYTTLTAVRELNKIGFTDASHPVGRDILRYLESGVHSVENNGWLFSIPSNDGYPHAPWWTYDAEANTYESIGVTAEAVCFILRFADKESEFFKRAVLLARKLIARLREPGDHGDMGVIGYCSLAETIERMGLADSFDTEFLSGAVRELVNNAIERDVSKWVYYGKRPSDFIRSPDSPFYKENEDVVQKELDYVIETRPENGVWGITWSWFDNNEKYPKEFAISENWWKADKAIATLTLLRNFGRLEQLP